MIGEPRPDLERVVVLAFARNAWPKQGWHDVHAHYERALAIYEKMHGPDHRLSADVLGNLGNLVADEGKPAEARTYFERQLAIYEKVMGPDHPTVAGVLHDLGWVSMDEKQYEAARGYFERALALEEKVLAPDHPAVSEELFSIAATWQRQDRPALAIPYFERSLALRDSSESTPFVLGETRFALARALWEAPTDAGRDRARARELARSAVTDYAAAGEQGAEQLDEVETWLAAR